MSGYWPTTRLKKAYHLALGIFLDEYGRTESAIALYLGRFVAQAFGAETDQTIALARALVVGQRTADLTDRMKRVMRVSGATAERRDELKAIVCQLGEIHKMRDRLAHFGGTLEFYEGAWMVRTSNSLQARERNLVEEVFFRIEDMEDMVRDLGVIKLKLRHALFPSRASQMEATKAWKDAQKPWQYKPARLKIRGPKTQTKSKRQDTLPSSCRG